MRIPYICFRKLLIYNTPEMIDLLFNRYKRNKYELGEVKTYSSREWLHNNTKRYQTVFYRYDVDYIYFELPIFNRNFKKKDWSCLVTISLYEISSNEEKLMTIFESNKRITKDSKIFHIREGWGNKAKGAFWAKGEYQYRIFINDDYASEVTFHVEDAALITTNINQYFEVNSAKLFEAGHDTRPCVKRVYSNEFEVEQTRYVYCELVLKNLLDKPWIGEFKLNIHTASGDLKDQIYECCWFSEDERQKEILKSCGYYQIGTFYKGDYTFKINFFNYPIAQIPFSIV